MTTTQGAARGQRMSRAARRAQLLDSAQAAFVELGYHGAAMDDIAVRAGVSKPVLYQHFPGKLELYLALLDKHCEALVTLVRDALASTTDNKERVYSTVAAYFNFVAQDGAAFRLIFESDLTNESSVRNRLDSVGLTCAEAVGEVISSDTGMNPEQALLLGTYLVGGAQTAARAWFAGGGQVSQEDAAEAAGHLAWRGIGGGFPKHEG